MHRLATQTHRPSPAPAQPRITGFAELTLLARDLRELSRFYTEVFGLQELSRAADRVWLGVGGGARLGLWSPGTKEFGERAGGRAHFAFDASEGGIDVLGRRAQAAGADVRGPVTHDDGSRSVHVTDPEGNVVEAWDRFAGGPSAAGLRGL